MIEHCFVNDWQRTGDKVSSKTNMNDTFYCNRLHGVYRHKEKDTEAVCFLFCGATGHKQTHKAFAENWGHTIIVE